MSILLALFLGIVQGLTEFLPVSSSGHLILFQHLFKVPDDMLLFNIILHLATLLAVIIVFRKRIWLLIKKPLNKTNLCILLATVITCTIVVLFKDIIDKTFTYKILPFSFLVTAILLFLTTFIKPKETHEVNYPSAAVTGIVQAIAVVPGLSRSGTTISMLLANGVNREKAAEFSFLMSIPIIIASFVYELLDIDSGTSIEVAPTIVAFIAALLSGIIAIKFMLKMIQNVKLHWFSIYLVITAIVCTCLFYF